MYPITTMHVVALVTLFMYAWAGEPVKTIHTSSGPVQGHSASGVSDVIEFLGIPYAQPPIGNLRFASPQTYRSNGSAFGARFVGQVVALPLFRSRLTRAGILVPNIKYLCKRSSPQSQRGTELHGRRNGIF